MPPNPSLSEQPVYLFTQMGPLLKWAGYPTNTQVLFPPQLVIRPLGLSWSFCVCVAPAADMAPGPHSIENQPIASPKVNIALATRLYPQHPLLSPIDLSFSGRLAEL